MQATFDFTGQTAIVTGAGIGIGQAVAFALAQAGANVMVNDLNPDRTENVAQQIKANGGSAAAMQGDVGNRFQAAALIETARDNFGRVDILINAAGVYKTEPMAQLDEWDWRRQLEVNLIGTFFCTQLMGRVMTDEGGGVIVNVAASAGLKTLPEGVGYVTSKAGVIALTRQTARELAPHQIRVNCVSPGNVAEPDMPEITTPTNFLGRAGTPDEVAQTILFLCSDAARFITGQNIIVDGGE